MQNAICASVTKQVEWDTNAERDLRKCPKNGQRALKQVVAQTPEKILRQMFHKNDFPFTTLYRN